MTGDLPAAALRLMSQCVVRTHIARESAQRSAKPVNTIPRAIIIGGVRFKSVNEASRKLNRADRTIRRWLLDGTAEKMTIDDAKGAPMPGRGGNNRKRIVVNGREYSSLGHARKVLHCSIHAIYDMLNDGRARYVSDADQRMVNLGRSSRGNCRRA